MHFCRYVARGIRESVAFQPVLFRFVLVDAQRRGVAGRCVGVACPDVAAHDDVHVAVPVPVPHVDASILVHGNDGVGGVHGELSFLVLVINPVTESAAVARFTIDNHVHPSVCIEIRHERIGTAYAENAAFRFRDVAESQMSGTVCRIIIDRSQTDPVVAVSGADDVQCPVSVDVCQGGLSLECSGEVVGREVGKASVLLVDVGFQGRGSLVTVAGVLDIQPAVVVQVSEHDRTVGGGFKVDFLTDEASRALVVEVQIDVPSVLVAHDDDICVAVMVEIPRGNRIVETFVAALQETGIRYAFKTEVFIGTQVAVERDELGVSADVPVSSLSHDEQVEVLVIVEIEKHGIRVSGGLQEAVFFQRECAFVVRACQDGQFIPYVRCGGHPSQ